MNSSFDQWAHNLASMEHRLTGNRKKRPDPDPDLDQILDELAAKGKKREHRKGRRDHGKQ